MFTADERDRLRDQLLERASADPRISGAALTGSAAEDREDRWSDVDLAFGIAEEAEVSAVLSDWSAHMYEQHRAVHHLDVRAGAWIYRVFLLADTLQVDLAFAPASEFRALAPSFRLLFGTAQEPRHAPPRPLEDLAGWGWLYALHARSAIARGKLWQADYMISGIRDHALALACVRHGLPAIHAKGVDRLPAEVTVPFEASLVGRLEEAELRRAFRAAMEGLLGEIRNADSGLAERIGKTLGKLGES